MSPPAQSEPIHAEVSSSEAPPIKGVPPARFSYRLPQAAGWPSVRRAVADAAAKAVWTVTERTRESVGVERYELLDTRGRPGMIRATRDLTGGDDRVVLQVELGRPQARDHDAEAALLEVLRSSLDEQTVWAERVP